MALWKGIWEEGNTVKASESSGSEGFTTLPTEFPPSLPSHVHRKRTKEVPGSGGRGWGRGEGRPAPSEVSSEAWCPWRKQIWAQFFC